MKKEAQVIKTQTVEEILAEHTTTSSEVKDAVKVYQDRQKEKKRERIIQVLGAIDNIVEDKVAELRRVRALEKKAQKDLLDTVAAKNAYLEDPNEEKLSIALSQSGVRLRNYIIPME